MRRDCLSILKFDDIVWNKHMDAKYYLQGLSIRKRCYQQIVTSLSWYHENNSSLDFFISFRKKNKTWWWTVEKTTVVFFFTIAIKITTYTLGIYNYLIWKFINCVHKFSRALYLHHNDIIWKGFWTSFYSFLFCWNYLRGL